MRAHKPRGWVAILALAVLPSACDLLTGPDGRREVDRTVRPGTLLSTYGERVTGSPLWSRDLRQVFYLATNYGETGPENQYLRAADAGSPGKNRVLRRGLSFRSFAASADGEHLFYGARHDDGVAVYRVARHGGPSNKIPGLRGATLLFPAPDGRHIVFSSTFYRSPEAWDLRVYDLVADTAWPLVVGLPLAFAPDGSELVYRDQDYLYATVALEDGATRPLELGIDDGRPLEFRWDDDGIHVLFTRYGREQPGYDLYIRNLATGETRDVYTDQFDGVLVSYSIDWSDDGSRIAFWVKKCLEPINVLSCGRSHYALYVADAETGDDLWIAGSGSGGRIVLAPDGRRVAYTFDGALYWSEVP